MKWLILYILKGRHERLLDKFHNVQYSRTPQERIIWNKVVRCRNRIRKIEPDFLKGFD